jgi:hypothetical protein
LPTAQTKLARLADAGALDVEKLKKRPVVTCRLEAVGPELLGDQGRSPEFVQRPGASAPKMIIGQPVEVAPEVGFADGGPVVGRGGWSRRGALF